MSDNKRNGRGFNGKGYYIALILCAAAIGISGFMYYQNNSQQEDMLLQEDETQDQLILGTMGTEALEAISTQPAVTEGTTVPATQQPSTEPTKPVKKEPLKTGAPVSGETLAGYAMDCLSYNQTTRDWRVHNGVDIAAEAGTEVLAAADGEVYTVYEDDSMGYTVVIRHDGGYTTKYSSLSEEVMVKAGDKVTLGQTIGYAGDSALVESVLGTHVHFSVTFQDAPMDPAEFLSMN